MRLPNERFRPGEDRPIGFQVDVTDAHVDRTITAMEELAASVTMDAPGEAMELSISLTSPQWMAGLPFQLYGFAIQDVDSHGAVGGDLDAVEIRYAILANQSVDLQREIAIAFFFQLLGRHDLVARALADRKLFNDLVDEASLTDEDRRKAASTELRGNWREAVKSLQAEASAAGMRLRVRYQPDPFPTRDETIHRLPALRRAYNELPVARKAVDRAVAKLSTHSWYITGGGSEQARRLVREHLETMQMARYLSQAARDAFVCGNGYLVVSGQEQGMRVLRPEAVRIDAGRYFEETDHGETDVTDGLIHQRGMRQIRSPYGASALELALHALRVVDDLTAMREAASALRRRGLLIGQLRELEEREDLAQRTIDDANDRLRKIFGFFLEGLTDAPHDLYFPGQENIR
jgi:hypothetical protein